MKRITTFKDFHLHPLVCGYVPLTTVTNRWNFVKSTAPYWRIYWNSRPGAFIRQDKRRIALKPDVIVIIPPNAVFSTRCDSPRAIQHFYIHFHVALLSADTQAKIGTRPLTLAIRSMIDNVIKLLQSGIRQDSDKASISLALRGLIEWLLAGSRVHWHTTTTLDSRILKVVRYIAEHLKNPMSNNELAQQAGMSVTAFQTLFRAQMGQTPHVYLRARRIEKACQLLHTADLAIKQIAALTGFYDCHHFSRVFKHLQGIGPAEFRMQGDNPFTKIG